MDEKLKYRLVGASVILALAVFFLPMILDSEKYRSQIQSQIPAVPSEHKSQHADIESSNANQPIETQLDGPVEKGPLVINLDDTDENKQSSSSNTSGDQSSQKPVAQKQEPLEQEQVVSSDNSTDSKSSADKSNVTKAEPLPKQEVVAKTEPENKPKTESKTETKPLTTDDSNKQAEQSGDVETTSKTAATATTSKEPKTTDDSELAFSDTAWLIQIGSFSNKDNATRLVGQLRDEGYRAYQRVGDSFARVYVGPYPVKGEAESRISALEKLVGAKVKVIEFDPKQH